MVMEIIPIFLLLLIEIDLLDIYSFDFLRMMAHEVMRGLKTLRLSLLNGMQKHR